MLLKRVKRTIEQFHLLDQGDRLIVGVSAGVDSMVLLDILNTLRQEFDLFLIVAHVNHGLRAIESEKEAELVRKESARLGLPFEYGEFNAKEFQESEGLSLQDAARRIRFQFFHELLQKYHAGKIVLGHNADDQVETVLLRLFRGSGVKGLKGMLPMRDGKLIRPLIEVWKIEIEAYAREKNIPYLLDSSNLKKDYLRNKLRLDLIPLIEEKYQPRFKKAVARTSTLLREENDYLERGAEEAYQEVVREEEGQITFKFSAYQSLHHAIRWRLVQKILKRMNHDLLMDEEKGGEVTMIYSQLEEPPPSFFKEIAHDLCLEKRYDRISLRKGRVKPIPPFEVELHVPGRTYIGEIEKEVVTEEVNRKKTEAIHPSPTITFFDYQRLQFPLRMRNFRPGDRFQPLGGKGSQKLKEFFIDRKIPKFERPRIPLLISGEIIAWIVGYRIDERMKVTSETKRMLKVEVNPSTPQYKS